MKNELAVEKQPSGALEQSSGLTLEGAFQAVIDGKISQEKLQIMKELLAMDAEQRFANAFVALQSELPVIVATSEIPNRGKYERFEDVMRQVQPFLTKHGFTVSFSQDTKDNRIMVVCHLTHGRHTRSNPFAVRAGGKSDSETQADCKAATTAKRNALLQALNIVIRQDIFQDEDNDASLEGNPDDKITLAQADELEHRLKMVNGKVPAFLDFAKAKSFREIQSSRYAELDEMLSRKERR